MTALPHEAVIAAIEDLNQSKPADEVAKLVLRQLSRGEKLEVLTQAIITLLEEIRRVRARTIEQSAIRPSRPKPPRMAATPAEEKERQEMFEKDRTKYSSLYGLARALSDYRTKVTLDLSKELLASTFQLGDGSSVTWGSATLSQHRSRIDLLMGNISGNMETMRIHELAADLISGKGVACLDQL